METVRVVGGSEGVRQFGQAQDSKWLQPFKEEGHIPADKAGEKLNRY